MQNVKSRNSHIAKNEEMTINTTDLNEGKSTDRGPTSKPTLKSRNTSNSDGVTKYSNEKHRKSPQYRFRRSALAAYFVIALLFGSVIGFLVFITEQPQGEAPTISVLEFCSIDELEECKERLQSRLSQGTIGILRTPMHFLFTLGSFVFAVLLGMVVQAYGARLIRKRLQLMPRKNIDLWSTMDSTTRASNEVFSREMYLAVCDEVSRVANLSERRFEIPLWNKQKGDVNWGDTYSYYRCAHFPTSIALSYQKLTDYASKGNPELKMAVNESVRDYVERLKRHLEERINPLICDQYVQMYEEAKFGNSDFTEEHYQKFINIMVYLFEVVNTNQTATT